MVAGWHVLALAVAFVVDWSLFAPLAVWTVVAVAVLAYRPGPHLPVAFALAVAEETLVYAFGGGLQGAATSLAHDYAVALPVFAALVLAWHLAARRYAISTASAFCLAGSHGLLLEVVLQGHLAAPTAAFVLGGPTVVIYGSIVAGPALPRGDRAFTLRAAVATWVGVTLALAASGVLADALEALVT